MKLTLNVNFVLSKATTKLNGGTGLHIRRNNGVYYTYNTCLPTKCPNLLIVKVHEFWKFQFNNKRMFKNFYFQCCWNCFEIGEFKDSPVLYLMIWVFGGWSKPTVRKLPNLLHINEKVERDGQRDAGQIWISGSHLLLAVSYIFGLSNSNAFFEVRIQIIIHEYFRELYTAKWNFPRIK